MNNPAGFVLFLLLLAVLCPAQEQESKDLSEDERYQEFQQYLKPSHFYPDGNAGQLGLLVIAVDRGDVELLRKLFKAAPNLAKVSEGGSRCSPIHWAAFRGDRKVLALILEHGESVNRTGTWQNITALHLAHDADTAGFLIEHGADIEAKAADGQTPLMWASERGHLDVVEYLVKAGAKVNTKDNKGATALFLAERRRRNNVADLLIQKGAERMTEDEKKIVEPRVGWVFNAGAPPESHPFSSWRLISVEPIPWPVPTHNKEKGTN